MFFPACLNNTRGLRTELFVFIILFLPVAAQCNSDSTRFTFVVAADMRKYAGPEYQNPHYFLGTCQAIAEAGKGAFMISPGDIDPPWDVYQTIKSVLGEDYPWFPVVGNHEAETAADMAWLREFNRGGKKLPFIVRQGPPHCEETTYSFDYRNAHFVVLNQYFAKASDTATDGDVSDELYSWLEADLEANSKPLIFVVGHEPLLPAPDIDNGRVRHAEDCLNAHPANSTRFLKLLLRHRVAAYFCGHTHNASIVNINGLWQIDAGHSRGLGDKGASSTFLRVLVGNGYPLVEIWRDDANGGKYELKYTWILYNCVAAE